MSEQNGAFRQRLLAIFADEARGHLTRIEEGLLALEQGPPEAQAASLEAMLKSLHTLKGAARSVDLDQLERLCHALENLCEAMRRRPGTPATPRLDLLHGAVGLARELTGSPSGRVLNRAAALCDQLDRAAVESAVDASAESLPGVPAAIAPSLTQADDKNGGETGPPGAQEDAGPGLPALLRIEAAQLDAIRTETEALLATELLLLHQVGELRALAATLARRHTSGTEGLPDAQLECARLARSLSATCDGLSGTRRRLMDAVLETALVSFSEALDELPALVRKLARARGREVVLAVEGGAVRIDRRLLGTIREALIHMVTNAVDHGIEPASVRLAAGKPAAGTLRVAVSQPDARRVLVRISDDGTGFDTGALVRAAGLPPDEAAQLDGRARLALALRAGVSTRDEVTALSGRGMGLAIVSDRVTAAGGTLALDSAPGQGSSFTLTLPVSLASLRALVVAAGGQRLAVPLGALEAVRALAPSEIGVVEDRETVVVQGRVLPLVRLAMLLGALGTGGAPGAAVPAGGTILLAGGARPFALLVDAILAEQDVLPRALGPLLRRVRFFSGATELGDGALVPVLSIDDIAIHALGSARIAQPQPTGSQAAGRPRRVLVAEDSLTSRLLLKHILEGAGCEVATAADGLAALSLLRQQEFDALVSDVEMPRLDGLALTARVRADPKTAELPVILVTSLQTPAERERGLQAGADAYLTKGAFDHDQLLAALRRLT